MTEFSTDLDGPLLEEASLGAPRQDACFKKGVVHEPQQEHLESTCERIRGNDRRECVNYQFPCTQMCI